jgi:hypothetical protein
MKRFLLVFIFFTLISCSSSGNNYSSTTVDPVIQDLQDKVDELESKINATTLPPPTTQAPTPTQAPYIARTDRFPSGSSRFVTGTKPLMSEYECRIIDYYSDGTSVEGSRYWVKVEQWRYGSCG